MGSYDSGFYCSGLITQRENSNIQEQDSTRLPAFSKKSPGFNFQPRRMLVKSESVRSMFPNKSRLSIEQAEPIPNRSKQNWSKVGRKVGFIAKMSKINDNIVNYGTSKELFDLNSRKQEAMIKVLVPEIKSDPEPPCIFQPTQVFSQIWSIVIILLLLYTAYVMPYKMAFIDEDTDAWFAVELSVDFLFLIDIAI